MGSHYGPTRVRFLLSPRPSRFSIARQKILTAEDHMKRGILPVSLRVIKIRRFWTTVHTYVLSLNDRFAYSTRNQSNRTACIVRASWENLITSQDEHEEEPRRNDETLHAGLYKGHRLGFTKRKITESSVERGPEYRK